MLAFCRKGVRKTDPRCTKARIHDRRLAEMPPRLCNLANAHVVYANGEPGHWLLRMPVDHVVRQQKEIVLLTQLVQASQVKRQYAEFVLVYLQDAKGDQYVWPCEKTGSLPIRDLQAFCKATLCRKHLASGKHKVGIVL